MATTVTTTLPAPQVVEALDFEAILAAHRADLIARHPAAAAPLQFESEPLAKLIEAHAYRELLYRARVNDAARAYLLEYATGTDLDHKGDFYRLPRISGESDDSYRARITLRIVSLNGNGSKEAYELVARTTSLQVRAAVATQTAPGRVQVLLWLVDGADAPAVSTQVNAALQASRPLGVVVSTAMAVARPLHVHATIYRTASAPTNLLATLQTQLQAAVTALQGLGQDVDRAWVTTQLRSPAGVARVVYASATDNPPELLDLQSNEFAVLGTVTLMDGGVAA